MDLKISKLTTVSFAAMAALTVLQYFFWNGGVNLFASSWIWYLQSPELSTFLIDGAVMLILLVLILSGKYFYFKENKTNTASIILLILFSVLVKPIGSEDLSYYFSQGKVAYEKRNTFTVSWQRISFGDESVKYYNTDQRGYPYGPIMLEASSLLYGLSGKNLIVFSLFVKLLNIFGIFWCASYIYKIKKLLGSKVSKNELFFLVLFQPLILFEVLVNGHNDIWIALLSLMAIYFAIKDEWQYVLPVLIIGIWIKFLPLITLPIFLVWFINRITATNKIQMLKCAIVGTILSVLITVVAWFPFWQGGQVFSGIIGQFNLISRSPSIFSIVHIVSTVFSVVFNTKIVDLLFIFASFIFALYLAFPVILKVIKKLLSRDRIDNEYFIKTIFLASLIYLFFIQKTLWNWYFVWPLLVGFTILNANASEYFVKIMKNISTYTLLYYPIHFLPEGYFFKNLLIKNIYIVEAGFGLAVLYAFIICFSVIYLIRWRRLNFE